jgi:hypothetical protein
MTRPYLPRRGLLSTNMPIVNPSRILDQGCQDLYAAILTGIYIGQREYIHSPFSLQAEPSGKLNENEEPFYHLAID